jgi:putative ABC transport system ATP-binding protein
VSETILEINQLKKIIKQKDRPYLFTNVSAEIKVPSIISVLGTSGQGKSTLLRIIGVLDTADEGTVRYRNRLPYEWQPQAWRCKVSYVAQQAVMFPGSVEENLRTVSQLHRQAFDKDLAIRLMSAVKLEELDWNKKAVDLSGGEKQRLALVRAILLRPEIMLLDEVTASLDIHSKHAVEQLLMDWHNEEGTTLIWVTHDVEQARHTSSHIWFMGEGTLLENSSTTLFFAGPATDRAAKYLQVSAGAGEQD